MRRVIYKSEDGVLEMELFEGQPYLHLQLQNWSLSKFKEYKRMFETIKKVFRDEGFKQMYVGIPDNDPKLLKFEKMFGFEIIDHKNGSYLLAQEV